MKEPTSRACECGEIYGEACPGHAEVKIEVMPVHLRARHEAARNRGVYPGNGAVRIRVSRECADALLESEGDWAEVV